MRSKALGISSSSSKPTLPSPKKSMDKENKKSESNVRVTEMTKKAAASPRKSSNNEIVRVNNRQLTPARTVSSKTKDDADVAVEINITSNQNIQVRKRKNNRKDRIIYEIDPFRLRLKLPSVKLTKMGK